MSQDKHKLARMLKVVSLATLVATTVPALATDYDCKGEIKGVGYGLFFKEWGNSRAKRSWSDNAIADWGPFYGVEATADEGEGIGDSKVRCAPWWFGFMVCEVKAHPCVIKTELECTHKDSYDCDPKIKWIQSKLSAKRYSVGQIDGISGEKFGQAIAKFKTENNMPDGSTIDDVVEVLNKPVQKTAAVESKAKALLSNSNVRRRTVSR